MESTLVNKVVNSGLLTIDLDKFYPEGDFIYFDIKDYLFQGLILKEKDFRTALKEIDWAVYKDKNLLIVCSEDAILPLWSFMLVAAYATPYAKAIFQGDKDTSRPLPLKFRAHKTRKQVSSTAILLLHPPERLHWKAYFLPRLCI